MTTSPSFSKQVVLTGAALLSAFFVAGCNSVTGAIDSAVHTASGTLTDVKHAAQNVAEPIIETANDVQRRINEVGSGVTKLRQGMEQVKGAINAQ